MQDPASTPGNRRRSWSRHTSKATCGLIKPSSSEADPDPSPSQDNSAVSQSMPCPPRKQSLRERFFTVGAANTQLEKDRELKKLQQPPYVPTHAASSFQRTTSPRQNVQHLPTPSSPGDESEHYTTSAPREQGPTGPNSDYAAFLSQTEARDVARELYGEHPAEETAPKRKMSNRVARRIAEYVKPTRDERS